MNADLSTLLALIDVKTFSAKEVAAKLRVSPTTVYYWKKGQTTPQARVQAKISALISDIARDIDILSAGISQQPVIPQKISFVGTINFDPIIMDIWRHNSFTGSIKINDLPVTKQLIDKQGLRIVIVKRASGLYEDASGHVYHPTWLKNVFKVGSEQAIKAEKLMGIERQILELVHQKTAIEKELNCTYPNL